MNLYEFSYGEIRERIKEYNMLADSYNTISDDTTEGNVSEAIISSEGNEVQDIVAAEQNNGIVSDDEGCP